VAFVSSVGADENIVENFFKNPITGSLSGLIVA
jgi:hypothetical protein